MVQVNHRNDVKKYDWLHLLFTDKDWLHLLFTDKSTVSRTGLLGDSPMSTNVKTFSRDTPSKKFTR